MVERFLKKQLTTCYFRKKASSYMFDWVLNMPLLPVKNKETNHLI